MYPSGGKIPGSEQLLTSNIKYAHIETLTDGILTISGGQIHDLGPPTGPNDAATVSYVNNSTNLNPTLTTLTVINQITTPRLTGLSTPTVNSDAANKQYVDSITSSSAIQFQIQVQKNPTAGQFSSIKAALDSITDATVDKPYLVQIGPGIYNEDQMNVPSYVSVRGSSINPTIVSQNVPNQYLFIMDTFTELSFMTLQGISNPGSGFSAVFCQDVGDFAQMHKISIYDFDIGVDNFASTTSSTLYVEYTDVNGDYSYAVRNRTTGTNAAMTVLEDFFSYPSTSATKTAVLNDGTNAKLQVTGSTLYGSTGMRGIVTQNGGVVLIGSVLFQDFSAGGVVSLNTGAGAVIKIDGSTFSNCTPDFTILNTGTTGYFFGNSPKSNHNIINGSTFFIAGQDSNIINVAKAGGDFTSIKAAVDSITNASPTNLYLIKIGPGVFFESTIVMKLGVFLLGYFLNATTIVPTNPNSTVIVTTDLAYIKDVYITGATGVNGIAVSFIGTYGIGTLIRDCAFGDNTTNVKVFGNAAPTLLVIDRCTILGNCTECFIITNNPGVQTRVTIDNTFYRDLVTPVCTNFLRAAGVGVTLNIATVIALVATVAGNKAYVISDGVDFKITGSSITGFDTGIYVPSGSPSPCSILGSGNIIENSGTYDIYIGSANTVGSWFGSVIYSKVFIQTGSLFYIANADTTIITVQKSGGNFTSIVAAMASIIDATSIKRYVINVGAGTFTEGEIVLKQYVSLRGVGRSTVVQPDSVSHHIIRGCDYSEIVNMILTGAGTGFAAVYQETVTGASNTALICRDLLFGLNDIHLWTYGNVGEAHVILFDARYGGTAQFNKGFLATNNNNSVVSKITIIGSTSQGFTSPLPLYIGYASGTNCTLSINGFNALNDGTIESGTIGFKADNGGSLRLLSCTIKGFDTAIYAVNSGSAPNVISNGCSITNCNTDINIDHPATTGALDISANRLKVQVNGTPPVSIFLVDPVNTGIAFDGPFFYSNSSYNQITDISNLLVKTPTMGLISGGTLSVSSGLVLAVSLGTGYNESLSGILSYQNWSAGTITLTTNSNSYIYINSNGIISVSASFPDSRNNIILGLVSTDSSNIIYIQKIPLDSDHWSNNASLMLRSAIGPVYSSGSSVAELGTRQLNVSQGSYFFSANHFLPGGGSPVTFTIYYRSGTPGLFTGISNQITVPNTSYDDGTGTLHALTASYYTKYLLLLLGGPSEVYALIYGQAEYSTSGLAEAAGLPIVPSFITDAFIRVVSIVVQQGAAQIVSFIDERPRIGFASTSTTGVITVHGDLLGLSANDHPQYLLVDGSAPGMTGNLNMNGNQILNSGLINSINLAAHGSRHGLNSSDPLPTPTLNSDIADVSGTAGSIGISNTIPRSDHVHFHGNLAGGTLHAVAIAAGAAGFLSGSDKSKLDSVATGATNTTPSNIAPLNVDKSVASSGVSAEVSRVDHKHDITTAAPTTTLLTSTANTQGAASSIARSDHTHAIASDVPVQITPDQTIAIGNSTAFARADHIHNIPTGVAAGLNANSTNTQGAAALFARSNHIHAIASAAPTSLQIFGSTPVIGTSSGFARADHVHIFSSEVPQSISASSNIEGTSLNFARGDHIHAHGSLSDPTLHSVAVAGSNAGFMSGADKLLLNNLAALPNGQIFVGSVGGVSTAVNMSGDATIAAGGALTLAASGVIAGTYNPISISVNNKGLLTSVSKTLAPGAILLGNNASIAIVSTLSGDVVLDPFGQLTISNTGVTGGTYSTPTSVTVNNKGQVSSITSALSAGQIILGSVTNLATNAPISGDATLSGTGALTVTRINGTPLGNTSATTTGSLLVSNGTNWTSQILSGAGSISSSGVLVLSDSTVSSGTYLYPTSLGVSSKGIVTSVGTSLTNGSIVVGSTGGTSNAVAISGDISLVASGATVVGRINGTLLGNTSAAGAGSLLIADGSRWISRGIIGDINIDSTGNVTVTRINGVGLGNTAANAGSLLIGSGSQWISQAISGDATLSTGGSLILATSGVVSGFYTLPTALIVNSKGQLTSVTNALTQGSIIIGSTGGLSIAVPLSGDISIVPSGATTVTGINGTPLGSTAATAVGSLLVASGTSWVSRVVNGDATLGSSGTLVLSTSGVTSGVYVPTNITVNTKGLVTSVSQALASGSIIVGSTGGVAVPVAISGDISLASGGVTVVTRINGSLLGATTPTSSNILVANGTSWVSQSVSGDISLGANGAVTVTRINGTPLGVTTATAGNLLFANGTSWVSQTVGGDGTIGTGGALVLATSGVTAATYSTPTSISVNNKGQITAVSSLLAAGSIIIGSATNLATGASMSGDASLSSAGVVTVTRINTVPLGVTTATAGNLLIANGTSWVSQSISGDAVLGTGGVLVLTTSGVTAATYSTPTSIGVNNKGQITAVSSTLASGSFIIGSATNLATNAVMSGDASLGGTGAVTLATVNASPGTTNLSTITTNGKGLVTSNTSGALSGDVTSAGLVTTYSGIVPLNKGGTNANLTANNGGIFYSTGTAGAILAGTPTAGQILLSGTSSAPSWSSVTHPSTTTVNQLLYSSANNVISGLTTANSAVLVTSATGVPGYSASLTNGQLIIGQTGSTPAATSISGDAGLAASGALTLTTVNANTGSWGSATQVPQFTVNAKGLITAAANVTITGLSPGSLSLTNGHIFVGSVSNVAADVAVSGDATITNTGSVTVTRINGATLGTTTATAGNLLIANGTSWVSQTVSGDATIGTGGVLVLTTSGVTAATYSTPTSIGVNSKGQITAVSSTLASGSFIIGSATNLATNAVMSGDASLGGTGAVTLATVNASPGTTNLSTITTNGKGLVTSNTTGVLSGDITSVGLVTTYNGIVPSNKGGTGVNNGSNNITLGGNLTTSGGFDTTITTTATTSVTLPPAGALFGGTSSFNTAMQSQTTVAGTIYYVTKSGLLVPGTAIRVGTTAKWVLTMSKSALGTGAFNIKIFMGTNGTTADTAEVSQSIGTQTAALDNMILHVQVTFTAVGAGTGSIYWSISPQNKAITATGFGCVTGTLFSGTVGSLTTTTSGLILGLGFQSVTGTPLINIPLVDSTLLI